MARWYKGFRCKGNPENIRELVVKQVHENGLAGFVPSVKPEKLQKRKSKKRASSRKTSSNIEFYLFISVESNEIGQLPSVVASKLVDFLEQREQEYRGRLYKIVQWTIPDGFLYEEIKGMAEKDFDVHNFTQSIPYKLQPERETNESPFEFLDLNEETNEREVVSVNSLQYEKLLYLLSTLSQGTWESFKKVCQSLDLKYPGSIQRRLKLLGHIEFSPNGKHWSIAPTALVRLTSNISKPEFLLCGQQSEVLLQQLRQYAKVDLTTQHQGNSPPCVKIRLAESQSIESLIENIKRNLGLFIHDSGRSAENLVRILPTLEGWKLELAALQGIVPSLYNWKRFDGNDWLDCIFSSQTGMYQMWKLNERESSKDTQNNHPLRTLFYDADTNTWRQGDWYGLRFLALYYSEQKCIAHYDPATLRFAVPYSQRFPEIYERALVLASGLLPKKKEQNLWLIYENVGRELAEQLTQKLYVTLEERID